MSNDIAAGAVIIGAGAGKRFGGPKAVATLPDGRRFLDAVVETAVLANLSPVIAVLLPGVLAPAGLRVVVNSTSESEQIVSVRLGLAQLTNTPVEAALVWPVDHPFVQLDSILALLDGARRSNASIVVPTHDGRRGHPTFFHRDTWRELMTIGSGGARAVIQRPAQRVLEVPVPDAGVVHGINTRDDLADALRSR